MTRSVWTLAREGRHTEPSPLSGLQAPQQIEVDGHDLFPIASRVFEQGALPPSPQFMPQARYDAMLQVRGPLALAGPRSQHAPLSRSHALPRAPSHAPPRARTRPTVSSPFGVASTPLP